MSCILAAAPLLHVLVPFESALADGITIKQKSRGCNEGSHNRCVLGAQLTRRNKPVSGQVLQLLRSTDGGESFSRFGNSGRKTDQQGQVIFRFAAPDEETCYEVRTGPNGNARRDYYSRILCIGDSSNNNDSQDNNNNSDMNNDNDNGDQDSVNNDNTTGDNNVDNDDNSGSTMNEETDDGVDAAEDSFNGGIDDIEQEADGDGDQQDNSNSGTSSVN